MRFTLNLATKAYLDHRLINRWIAVGILLLLVLLVWNVSRLSWDLGEMKRIKAEIAAMETKLDHAPGGVSEKDFQGLLADIAFFNGIIESKTFNWLGLLDQLERATPEGISLQSLVPDARKKELRIEGHARSFAQVKAYLEMLEESKAFSRILLLSHKNSENGDQQRGVSFSLSCSPGYP